MIKPHRRPRHRLGTAAFALFLLAAIASVVAARPTRAEGRVVLLGFDGADARTTAELMQQGELPNLKRLAEGGTFAALGTTAQAESPVAWASLNTGKNPGKTGIPGFIQRVNSGDIVMPTFGHTETVEREIGEMELGFWLGLLASTSPGVMVAIVAALVLVGFLIVFAGLLKMSFGLALVLSLVLSAIGAFGTHKARGYLPDSVPGVVANPIKAQSFWELAAEAKVPSIVLDAAMAWDRPNIEGARVLAGLGVPDARGANGDWFIYTSDELEFSRPPAGNETKTGGMVFRVDERDGKIDTQLCGPNNFWQASKLEEELDEVERKLQEATGFKQNQRLRERKRKLEAKLREPTSVPLTIEKLPDGRAQVSVAKTSQILAEGEWSDWYHVTFRFNPLIKAQAITRLKIVELDDPYFEMYVNTLDIDPSAPPFWQPISQPASFARELEESIGEPYETVGWACVTMAFKDREIDVETFLEDVEFTMSWREKLTYACLQRDDWKILMSVFSTTDRVQHMMYQYYDPQHPLYDAEEAAREVDFFGERIPLSDVIPAIYRQMDRVVGKVMDEHIREGDTLMLCADHGFQSFRRGLHVNNWLAERGYLKADPELPSNEFLEFIDWGQTKAYAVGLGMIYLNLQGREPQGIVAPGEAEQLIADLRRDLLADLDPETGKPFIKSVSVIKDIHSGPHIGLESDLMLGFDAGYRVSWSTSLGGISRKKNEAGELALGKLFSNNKNNWSGDHVSVDPDLVRGIFFCNRPISMPPEGVDLLHIAPTVLSLVDVAVPADCDLAPLDVR